MNYFYFVIFILFQLNNNNIQCDAAKILAPFSSAGKSHMNFFYPLLHELARRGHDVTVIAPYPSGVKLDNYNEIILENGEKFVFESFNNTMDLREKHRGMAVLPFLKMFSVKLCEFTLENPRVQAIIKGNKKFDLIIASGFFSECQLGWLHINKDASLIHVLSFGGWNWLIETYGNPQEIATVPELLMPFTQNMSFLQRTINFVLTAYWRLFRDFIYLPEHQKLINKYFGDDAPYIKELEQKSSLLIMNSEISLGLSRAFSNNIITAGGIHLSEPKPLPVDLKKWMDESKDGIIYFSLGSGMRSSDIPKERVMTLIRTFKKLKQRIIWKWEDDNFPEKSPNINTGKWWPQKDLLAHPNVLLFITHGGLLSTQEAVYHGIPLIGIPCMADQDLNMQKAQEKGLGIKLEMENITEISMSWALNEVLNNPSYKKTAKHLSEIFRDQPISPLEKATFWTEYVIRHKGAPHLSNPARKLYWFQRELLDVYLVLFLAVTIPLWILWKIVKITFRCFRKPKPTSKSKSKKSKKE